MIKGSAKDYLIPLKYNIYFKSGVFLAAVLFILLFMCFAVPKDLEQYAFVVIIVCALFIAAFLGLTKCGRDTVKAYRRTKDRINYCDTIGKITNKHKNIDDRFQESYSKTMYCTRAGVRAAAAEFKRTDELIARLADSSCLLIMGQKPAKAGARS